MGVGMFILYKKVARDLTQGTLFVGFSYTSASLI